MVAPIDIIENYECYSRIPNFKNFDMRYYLVRTMYVISTGIIAILVPNISLFIDFVGALAGTSTCFIFPIIIYEVVFRGKLSTMRLISSKVILLFGLVFGGTGVIASFIALVLAF